MISQSIHDVKEIKIKKLKGRTNRSDESYVVREITITTDKDIDINVIPMDDAKVYDLFAKGLTVGQRTASNVQKLIKNGTVITTNASASIGLSALNVYLLCRNNNGTAQLYSVNQMSMSFIGSGVINQSTLYTATQALGTSIGWAV